jgi:fibronectin type 3 domain-containing protein
MTGSSGRSLVRQGVRIAALAGAAVLVALLLTSASTGASAGLVAAYAFDEGSGTTVSDASGNGNTGTISGATWSTGGKYGSALSFNGSSSRVTIPNSSSLQLSSGMTLEAWVNPTTVSSAWRDVIEKGNDNYFLMGTTTQSSDAGGGGIIGGSYGQVFTTSPLPTNSWSFLALTYDGATERLYLNGTQVASLAHTGAITSSTNALTLGSDPFYGQFFNGLIDNIRIYNSALSAAAIQTDMTTAVSGTPDTTPPSAPGTLTATVASASEIDLSWGAATDNAGIANYQIWRCQGAGCSNFAQVGTTSNGTTTTYQDKGLSASTSYSYQVRAVDTSSNPGPYSNTVTKTTPASDTTPPSAPGTLTATAASSAEIDLSWGAATDNAGIANYQIWRCQGPGCSNFSQVGTTSNGTTTTYQDKGLSASTSYSYEVRAVDTSNNPGPYSNTSTDTTQSTDNVPPSAPGTLTATAASSSEIDLSWGAATDNVGIGGYRIDRCAGVGCTDFSHLVQLNGTGTTYQDTAVSPATSYSYQVRAVDQVGNLGPYSNAATATTPAAPSGLVASYGFEEGSGTTVSDVSGNGNTGTIASATWTTAGKFGDALSFNGTSSRVTIPNSSSLQLGAGMTLEAWVDPATVSSAYRDVIEKGNDEYFLMGTTDHSSAAGGGGIIGGSYGQVFTSSGLPTSTWSHLAVTYDGSTERLYLNGAMVDSVAHTGTIASSTNALTLGSDPFYGQYFNGLIDEVRIYNKALTATQIQSDMNTAIGVVPSTPTNLTATPVTTTQVNLSWSASTDSAGVTGYRLERCQGAGCTNFAQIASPAGTTYSDTGLTAGTTYVYRVRAVDSRGTLGPYSDPATAFTGLLLNPRRVALTPAQTQQYSATIPGAGATQVTWSVDGIAGGTTATGTITTGGVYTAPAAAGTHTITATTPDQSQSVNATAYITNYAGMFTYHDDNLRTGANLNETVLTPSNVNSSSFGKLFSRPLDGIAYASPLYVENVSIPADGPHNVVYVATEHDSVYAFDADGRSTTPLWKDSFIDPANGITTKPAADTGECCDIAPEIGITGTPVIDKNTNTLYVVAATKEVVGGNTSYKLKLHALDLSTGAEKLGGPVAISASTAGTGLGNVNGQIVFDPLRENQRPALLLLNGTLYIGFSSHGDFEAYHGWILGYNASTLQKTMTFCLSPNTEGGGVWMSGGGLASDASGDIFFVSGDGEFDGTTEWGDSYLRLTTAGTVKDFFTPFNQSALNQANHDLGSGGALLLPDQPGAHPHEMLSSGKDGTIYLVDRDNMGKYNTSTNNIVQTLANIFPPNGQQGSEPGNFSTPIYLNGTVYFIPNGDNLQGFSLTNGLLSTSAAVRSSAIFPDRGGAMAASANGSSSGIIWAVQRNATNPGVLYAYNATSSSGTLAELYDSSQAGTRDTLDAAAKFNVPVVANGKVFVAGTTQLTAYGLLP